MKRAAISIGVNRAGSMQPLQAAVRGAQEFHAWAETQGCDTTLLVDQPDTRVSLAEIFDAVQARVDAGTYEQLIVYFSGHGILQAPGNEYWLLSSAPENSNEAVNLPRSIEEARNSGIPHVVFVSDACRSSVAGPPLSAVSGGCIFPSGPYRQQRAEIDVFYATRPGDPAHEVLEAESTKRYKGIFTDTLLRAVKAPLPDWVESIDDATSKLAVVTPRRLKPFLETTVQSEATAVDVKLRQEPEVRTETVLPKFFAVVDPKSILAFEPPPPEPPPGPPPGRGTRGEALAALGATYLRTDTVPSAPDQDLAGELGLAAEVERLVETTGRDHFETQTGFTLFSAGSAQANTLDWAATVFREGDDEALHVRLTPPAAPAPAPGPASIVFAFEGETGTLLPVLPGFIGTVVVEAGRVVSVNYVPSRTNWRYPEYEQREQELEQMKAYTAVAARNGRFVVDDLEAGELADRIRQPKGVDPAMGIYAAYAYAQIGNYEEAHSVYTYMLDDVELPVPFDVLMLASRFKPDALTEAGERFAPFAPVLSQGWALLTPGDPMYRPIHEELRPHLVPSLWTTLDAQGIEAARQALMAGTVR